MRPWGTPEQWTQNYYQPPTGNGYVGGLLFLQRPEAAAVGHPSQRVENSNKVIDLCSDDENEVKAPKNATPSTVPASSIQSSEPMSGNFNDGHQLAQQMKSSTPEIHHSYIERQHPSGETMALFKSQPVGSMRSPFSSGSHVSDAQAAPRSTAPGYRNPLPPSTERNLRAEYVNLMQKAKYRFEVAAAGGNGPLLPNTATPAVHSQQNQNYFGYHTHTQQYPHVSGQPPSSNPHHQAYHEGITSFDRNGEDIVHSRPFIRRPSTQRKYELSPIPPGLPRASSQQTTQQPSSRTTTPAQQTERPSPAQSAASSSTANQNFNTVAAQSASNIDRASNAAIAVMYPGSAASQHSQRATPVSAVQPTQSVSTAQNVGTITPPPVALSENIGQTKVTATATTVMPISHVVRTETPAQTADYPKSELGESRESSERVVQPTARGSTDHSHTPTAPAAVAVAQAAAIDEAVHTVSNSPSRPSREHSSPRNLPFASIPPVARALMFSWQRAHGKTELPFAVGGSMVPLVNQSKDGLPAVYRSQDGVQYQVNIYGLPVSWSPSGNQRLAVIATDPKGNSFIIGRHKNMSKVRVVQGLGIPYCIWTGMTQTNQDGWGDEPSIYKTWDGRPVMRPSKVKASSKQHAPLHLFTPPSAASKRKHIDSDVQKAISYGHQAHLSPGLGRPTLDHRLCVRSLPLSLKQTIQQWQVLHGSNRPLPCAMLFGNYPWVYENASGKTFSYYHRNGDALMVWVCRISRALSGDKTKDTVIMATGKNTPPCIISSKRYYAFQGAPTNGGNWCVWEGLKGRGEYGFEKECSITKVSDNKAPSRRVGSKDILPAPLEQEASGDTTEEDSIDGELLRLADSGPSVTASTNTSIPPSFPPPTTPSARSDALPESHDIPKPCRQLINEWFYRHPNQSLHSLPCISTSARSTLFETGSTKQATEWYDIYGQQLSVEMYSLFDQETDYTHFHPLNSPGPGHPSSSLFNKRVIVVQGFGMAPTLVSLRAQNKYVDGKLPIQRWVGVAGDSQGWELGQPDIFKCNVKDIRENWERSFPGTHSSGNAYQRPHSQQPATLSSILGLAEKPQRTECGACYARHKKCDGKRPICGQCAIGGRICDYDPVRYITSRVTERMQEVEPEMVIPRSEKENSINEMPMTTRSRTKPTPRTTGSTSVPLSKRQRPSKSMAVSELWPHLQSHLVCLFYSYSPANPAPRARLFAACDTVQKLFAQAMAGGVFADEQDNPKGRSSAKVLGVTLGGKKRIAVAEEDKEDFDSVVDAVAEMGWWLHGEEGDVVGSGTLEVRAFV